MSLRRNASAADAFLVSLTGRLMEDPELRVDGTGDVCVLHLAVPRGEGYADVGAFPVEAVVVGTRVLDVAKALMAGCEVRVSGRLDVAQWASGEGKGRRGLQLLAHDIAVQAIVLEAPTGGAPRGRPVTFVSS